MSPLPIFALAPSSVAVVSSTATWSSTAKNGNITISGAGLIATGGGAGATHYAGLGTAATTTIGSAVKRFWQCVVTTNVSGGGWGIGVGNVSTPVGDGQWLGSSPQSFSWYNDGKVYSSGSQVSSAGTFAQGDTLSVAATGASKMWLAVNGVYTGDPVAGTGGVDISSLADVFPGYNLNSGDVLTAIFAASGAPSGFSIFP